MLKLTDIWNFCITWVISLQRSCRDLNPEAFLVLLCSKFTEKGKPFLILLEYHFLVESSEIENATFSYKTSLSKSYVKIIRMGSAKWTNHKERSFVTNCFFFSYFLICSIFNVSYFCTLSYIILPKLLCTINNEIIFKNSTTGLKIISLFIVQRNFIVYCILVILYTTITKVWYIENWAIEKIWKVKDKDQESRINCFIF